MSEYCYKCLGCDRFSDDCICEAGFQDPMERYKDMDLNDLMDEIK